MKNLTYKTSGCGARRVSSHAVEHNYWNKFLISTTDSESKALRKKLYCFVHFLQTFQTLLPPPSVKRSVGYAMRTKFAYDKIYGKERHAKIIQISGNTCTNNWCCINIILCCKSDNEKKHILGQQQMTVLLFQKMKFSLNNLNVSSPPNPEIFVHN